MRIIAAITTVAVLTGSTAAQPQQPKPGPEHMVLKVLEGSWDTTMKVGGMEHKGAMTYKMELGGLWLAGSLASDLSGQKYYGKSMDTYDAQKKKYVGYWFDSMSATPMKMEGDFDKEKKRMTMVGEGPGMDGKPAKWKSVSEMPDKDTMTTSMFVGDAKEPMFTITYQRKK